MAEQHCIYPDREPVLVAYLYDDIETVDRVAFETHVATCEPCRTELAELRGVRSRLAEWAAPESTRRSPSPAPVSSRRWWRDVPAWAQLAAALLVLGVSASIANLDVRYDRANGLSVRTGWAKPAPAPSVAAAPAVEANPTPWRADLAAMQKQLRDEMRAQSATVAAAATVPAATLSDGEFRRRVQVLLDESEQKQRTDFATKLVQLQKDVLRPAADRHREGL